MARPSACENEGSSAHNKSSRAGDGAAACNSATQATRTALATQSHSRTRGRTLSITHARSHTHKHYHESTHARTQARRKANSHLCCLEQLKRFAELPVNRVELVGIGHNPHLSLRQRRVSVDVLMLVLVLVLVVLGVMVVIGVLVLVVRMAVIVAGMKRQWRLSKWGEDQW